METHLKACAACARELENQQALRDALRRASLSYAATPALRDRIQSSLRSSTAVTEPGPARAWYAVQIWRWAAAFAVLAVCIVTAWQLVPCLHAPFPDQGVAAA